MRIKARRSIALYAVDAAQKEAVQREIENFLQALSSYPERFAHDPYLTFEQHLCSIMAGEQVPAEFGRNVA